MSSLAILPRGAASDGRAESAVKRAKTMIRKALHQGGKDSKWWWPWAARYVNE